MPRAATPSKSRAETIRVLVAESSHMACQLLELALRQAEDLEVVSLSSNSQHAAEAVAACEPDVALISTRLEDGALVGLKLLRECRTLRPATRTIMLAERPDRDLIVDAFRAGAKGIFCRTHPLSALYRCISAVYGGQIWANSCELQYLLEALSSAMPLKMVNVKGEQLLSNREGQVVLLVAEGLSNREISERLHLSEHTIKNYLFRIFDKLGVSSRVELILYALSRPEFAQNAVAVSLPPPPAGKAEGLRAFAAAADD